MSINAETRFYVTKGIMTLEESKKLNNDREFLDYSLLIGDSTEEQVYKQIEVEIEIFHKCHAIIKKEKPDIHNKLLLVMLFSRINNMFAYMVYLFPINKEHALKFVEFCSNHIAFTKSPQRSQC